MMGYGWSMGSGGLWTILLVIAGFAFIVWGLQVLFSSRPLRQQDLPERSPEEVARRRYARGEISREDYLSILEDLELAETWQPEKPKRKERSEL